MDQEIAAIQTLLDKGEFEDAEERAHSVLRSNPSLADPARTRIGFLYAIACGKQLAFDKTVELTMGLLNSECDRQQIGFATLLLCNSFTQLGAPELARPFIDRLNLKNSPNCPDRCWLARLLLQTGATEEALQLLKGWQADFPGHPGIQYWIGVMRMSMGDQAGFAGYLSLASRDYWRVYYPHVAHLDQLWEGEPLEGKTIAIVPYGGYGDYFQVLRYVPALRRAGVREIVALANEGLHGLIASSGVNRLGGEKEIRAFGQGRFSKATADFWTPILGIERLCLSGESRAVTKPYLIAPHSAAAEQAVTQMRARAKGRPCIGLCWHSDAHSGEEKSIPLHELVPLLQMDEIHCVILQRGFGLRRLRATGLDQTLTVLDEAMTIDERAGVITCLDGVATICSWSLHLAGALGVRTWLLAGRVMSYRHQNREKDSVLYPGTVTLARQPTFGDWRGAVRILREDLRHWLHERAHRSEPLENTA